VVRLVAVALLVACSGPSHDDCDDEAWERIADLAGTAPRTDPVIDHLRAAASYHLDQAKRITELEAWAEAGGRVVHFDPVDTFDDFLGVCGIGLRIAKERADDDRALEAALYLGQQLRANGALMNGMTGFAIARLAAEHRKNAPPFAARYAPTDAEVFRMFAGEAIWARTSPDGDRDAADATWRWLADAPRDRTGFTGAVYARAIAGTDMMAPITPLFAEKAYASVDTYQRWLAR
jgi:hypothetical protein